MKKTVFEMTEEERARAVEVIGNTILMMEEGYGPADIAEKLNLNKDQVVENVYEGLYVIRRAIGKWNFIKSLFIK